MPFTPENISFCGNCLQTFDPQIYYCPTCDSSLIIYDRNHFTEEFALMKWERHNKNGTKKTKKKVLQISSNGI